MEESLRGAINRFLRGVRDAHQVVTILGYIAVVSARWHLACEGPRPCRCEWASWARRALSASSLAARTLARTTGRALRRERRWRRCRERGREERASSPATLEAAPTSSALPRLSRKELEDTLKFAIRAGGSKRGRGGDLERGRRRASCVTPAIYGRPHPETSKGEL